MSYTIDALGGTSGAMTQLANTIDDNIQAISLGESMDEQEAYAGSPHSLATCSRPRSSRICRLRQTVSAMDTAASRNG